MAEQPASEMQTLRTLNGYLDNQNEVLDENDLERLRRFLTRFEGYLQGDWSRVLTSLEHNPDPLVGNVRAELQRKCATPEAMAQLVGEKVAALDQGTLRFAFLVGAGASCGKPTDIPAVRAFLPMLWNKAAEIGHRPLLRIRDQCESLGVRNIEDLLTAIALAQAAMANRITLQLVSRLISGRQAEAEEPDDEELRFLPPSVRRGYRASRPESVDPGIVDSLRDSTQTLFAVLVGMMVGRPSNAAHLSIAELCTSHPGTTVVTTNYDTCLEGALGGDAYTYGFEPRATSPSSPSVTRLAKLHGSLNWYSCVNCDRFIAAPLDEVGRAFQAGLYPIISICPSCQATAQQLIVPPIGQKYHDHPMFLNVRRVAEDAFRDAGVVFIVGYSFNEADEYILRMLSRATQEDSDKLFVVLDTDSSPCTRLIKFLQTHVRAFDVKQGVVQILGDASVTVPLLSAAVGRSLHASAEPISLATAS